MRRFSLAILFISIFFILFLLDFERALSLAMSFLVLWGIVVVFIIMSLRRKIL